MSKMNELMDFIFDDSEEVLHLGVLPSGTARTEEELAEAVLKAMKLAQSTSAP